MNIVIILDGLPHCPRNRSHTIIKKGKASFLGKTEAARAYEDAIRLDLVDKYDEMQAFSKNFNKEKDALVAFWRFYSPDVTTISGKISENGTDLDAHKVLQDTIMELVGIDDAYIVSDTRQKLPGDYRVELTLKIVDARRHYEEIAR